MMAYSSKYVRGLLQQSHQSSLLRTQSFNPALLRKYSQIKLSNVKGQILQNKTLISNQILSSTHAQDLSLRKFASKTSGNSLQILL